MNVRTRSVVLLVLATLTIAALTSAAASATATATAKASATVMSATAVTSSLVDAAEAALRSAASQPNWRWPVQSPWEIRREFVAPQSQYGPGHRGVDLQVGPGDEIVSPAEGTVFFAGVVVDRPVISIRHADGVMSSFEPVSSGLVAGQLVARGERIGTVTSGGHCADSCVHFGVRLHGQYISPRLPLGSLPRAVLLPLSEG